MNTYAYDNADENINGRIWLHNKKLYTKSIAFRKYFYFLKKYNNDIKRYIYYILVSDEDLSDKGLILHLTEQNRYGTVIINLFNIWNSLNINTNDENAFVNLTIDDKDDVSEIYKITII